MCVSGREYKDESGTHDAFATAFHHTMTPSSLLPLTEQIKHCSRPSVHIITNKPAIETSSHNSSILISYAQGSRSRNVFAAKDNPPSNFLSLC